MMRNQNFIFVIFSIAIIISLSSLLLSIQPLPQIQINYLEKVFGQTKTTAIDDSYPIGPLIST